MGRAFMASTMRGVALAALSEVPYPSCPCPLPPQENTVPPSASASVCLLAAAMAATRTRSADTLQLGGSAHVCARVRAGRGIHDDTHVS